MHFQGLQCASAEEAQRIAKATGGCVVMIEGTHFVVSKDEAQCIEAAAVGMARMHDRDDQVPGPGN